MRYVELFCGCGGLAEGLRQAGGWECLLAVDHDPQTLALYGANFPNHPRLCHDLNDPLPRATADALRPALRSGGVLAGGSPCQDFAMTCTPEKRQKGERAQLTEAFARHVADLQPTWVLFENVKYAARRTQYLAFVDELHRLGYATEHRILCLRDLGMAQPRYRLILVAHATSRDEVDRVWAAVDAALQAAAEPPGHKTIRRDLAAFGAHFGKNHVYYPVPRALDVQPSVFSLDDPGERRALFTVRGRTRPMPESYVFREKDSTQDRDDIFALQTVHLRALQGFPPSFRLDGPKGRIDQALGNAVPPPMAKMLGEAFLHARVRALLTAPAAVMPGA